MQLSNLALSLSAIYGGFDPLSLFTAGEQGAWYDPSDFLPNWRRNLLTYTEQFDNAAWAKASATVTANTTVAPDGTLTADTFIATGGTGIHWLEILTTRTGASTYSIYAKQFTAQFLQFSFATNTAGWVNFDLNSGTSSDQGTGVFGQIVSVGNGWYRCVVSVPADFATSLRLAIVSSLSATRIESNALTGGIYIWGAQLETGSTASTYQKITDGVQDYYTYQPQPILFQDSAGTTPVTAVEQPVGLVLDKSKGLVLGSELIGTYDLSGAGWGVAGGVSARTSNSFTTTSAGGVISSAGTVTVGVTYKILITGTTTASIFYVRNPATLTNSTSVSTGAFSISMNVAWTDLNQIYLQNGGAGVTTITSFSVKELPGNHAFQATSANRPIVSARVNLLTKTEDFSDAAWTKTRSSISANAVAAPDGTTTADNVVEDTSASTSHLVQQSTAGTVGASETLSVYVKAAGRSWFLLQLGAGATAYFDVTNGATGNVSGGTATIQSVGNGWYKCSLSATRTTNQNNIIYLASANGTINYTGDGTSGIYIWGADLRVSNDGVGIPAYQRVNTSTDYDTVGFPLYLQTNGSTQSLATNSIDFSTNTSDGQARRNLLTFPTAFDDAAWTKLQATITPNTAIAPDGTTTADKLVEDTTASSYHTVQRTYTATAAVYTFSVNMKAGERNWAAISLYNASTYFAYFNLATGAVGSVTPGATSAITSIGNGWYRCSITLTLAAASCATSVWVASADNTYSYTGDGTSGIYIWGAQLETGSTATAFQNIGTDKMTVWAGNRSLAATGMICELSANVSTNNGAFYLYDNQTNTRFDWVTKGTVTSNVQFSRVSPITNILTGIGDISGDSAILRVNGTQAQSTTDQGTGNYGAYPLYIGARAGTSLYYNGRIYGLVIRGAQSSAAQISSTKTWLNLKTKAY